MFYNVEPGTHEIKAKWAVDPGGTAYMGDRTMTACICRPDLVGSHGGVISYSAASGPDVTTTSTSFEDIPGLVSALPVPANATLVIGFSAEAEVSAGKRSFLRAVVDGETCSPSDVVMINSGFRGSSSYHFVKKSVAEGPHQVALQWKVDAGGTVALGDRNLAMTVFPAPAPDLTETFDDLQSGFLENQNLLVIGWDPHRPDHPAPAISEVRDLVFGNSNSVADYFKKNSSGRFALVNRGVSGWHDADKPPDHYWAAEDPADSDHDGWISGHVEKWAEAIGKADGKYDFSLFDLNGNGILEVAELAILIVIPQNDPFGTVNTPYSVQAPAEQPLVVDGISIPVISEAYLGSPPDLGNIAYGLCNMTLNLPSMWFWFFEPYAAGAYSLLDIVYSDSHLDPFQKIRMGWLQPFLVNSSGAFLFEAVETSATAHLIYDPAHGIDEYFVVENRRPGLAYDSALPDSGLAVWHIIENPDIYGHLPAPEGVDAGDWAAVDPADWGRRAIRMIRPVYGPPFDNEKALWDGSDPETGYDLLSDDPDPSHVSLKWADGSPSGIAIRNISASGYMMSADIEVAGIPVNGLSGEDRVPRGIELSQNYPNPFNPETALFLSMERPADAKVTVFDVLGQEVRILSKQKFAVGRHRIDWDGKDATGRAASSGVYLCRASGVDFSVVKKMILMR